jgi:hypothetical protein
MYVVYIMNQIHHFFNVPKKSNLFIIMAGGSNVLDSACKCKHFNHLEKEYQIYFRYVKLKIFDLPNHLRLGKILQLNLQ